MLGSGTVVNRDDCNGLARQPVNDAVVAMHNFAQRGIANLWNNAT
jgi:hypothetical protein